MINIIIDNHHFNVSKKTLLKSPFFEGLLEINSTNLTLTNIDPYTFKNLIDTLEEKDIIKNTTLLYDKFGFSTKTKLLDKYCCNSEDCVRLSIENKNYCELHKCTIDVCNNYKTNNTQQCDDHTCQSDNCKSQTINNTMFCGEHKCSLLQCDKEKHYSSIYCDKHNNFFVGPKKNFLEYICAALFAPIAL